MSGERKKDPEQGERRHCSVGFNVDQNFSYQSPGIIKGQEVWCEEVASYLQGCREDPDVQKGSCPVIIPKLCCF